MTGPTVVYAREEAPEGYEKSIFLIGPTPTENGAYSWRSDALYLLIEAGYDGVIFIPESRPDEFGNTRFEADYTHQVEWEKCHREMADVILAWVPRTREDPGITTNFELGQDIDSGKLVLGAPQDSWKTRYLRYWAQKLEIPDAYTLEDTVAKALELLGEGVWRTGGEREVPLFVWRTPHFQQWYAALKQAGNRLEHARVLWTWRMGPGRKFVFFWLLHPIIWIQAEGRYKEIEVVISRPDIATIVLYQQAELLDDSLVVLIQEFRSAAANPTGYVWEVAGGSSFKPNVEPHDLAADECREETGLRLKPERFQRHESRQILPTLSAHRAHLFSAELTDDEVAWLRAQIGIPHGEVKDTERTFPIVMRFGDIRQQKLVGWADLGMLFQVLA